MPRNALFLVLVLGLLPRSVALAQPDPWSAPQVIDTGTAGERLSNPIPLIDQDGVLNVVWVSEHNSTNLILRARYRDGAWSQRDTIYSTSQWILRFTATASETGTLWLAWHQVAGNDARDIYVMHSAGGAWSPPQQVPQPGGQRNFAPKIAARGGSVWVGWYSDSGSRSDVYVCRWDGTNWGEYRNLTADLGPNNWFTNVAVDSRGNPHVIWGSGDEYGYYYTTSHDGTNWSTPFLLNPLLLGVAAAGWPGCSLAIDSSDHPHVAWTGARIDASNHLEDWDIFYSKFDGHYWTSPQQVNTDDDDIDAYPEIAIQDSSNVWITWLDGNPASIDPYHVGAAHCSLGNNQTTWTDWRLDDDTYMYDHNSRVIVDAEGAAWVVWNADPPLNVSSPPRAVLARRFGDSVPILFSSLTAVVFPESIELRWRCEAGLYSAFRVERRSGALWETSEIVPARGSDYVWTDTKVTPGNEYSYRITAIRRSGQEEVYGPVTARTGEAPAHFVVHLARRDGDVFHLLVGIGHPSSMELALWDIQGRPVNREEGGWLTPGWQDVVWRPSTGRGRRPANGIYWLTLRAGMEEATVKIVLAR